MPADQRFSILLKGIIFCCIVVLAGSCGVVPKNYPRNKPFVFKYNINVEGNQSSEEKKDLVDKLENQLDDSIRVRTVNKFFYKGLYRPVLINPPAFDQANADKSILFMKALLKSLGYYYDSTYAVAAIDSSDSADGKFPTTVNFYVRPNKLTKLDSISYNLDSPMVVTNQAALQQLTKENLGDALIKKGDAFSKAPISAELDRLVELYRNNGYLKFTRKELIGIWDTVDVSLLSPTLDPFEQLEILQKLAERRNNPTANLEIRLNTLDSTKLVKYYVGKVFVYPDFIPDTVGKQRQMVKVAPDMYVVQYGNRFKPRIFPIYIPLLPGSLYSQRRYQRTINRFNAIGAWKLVDIVPEPRTGQDTVDFRIHLTPATKYLFTANIEASQNQSAVAGNLLGLGVNVGVQNRNFAKAANLAVTNGRFGIELGKNFIQTQQVSISHNIYYPRPVLTKSLKRFIFGRILPATYEDNVRTNFSFNGANTERRELYNLTSINGSWGYEFQRTVPRTSKTHQVVLKLPNIEYAYLKKRKGLQDLIDNNPALANIFSTGFIASVIGGYTRTNARKKHQYVLAFNAEHSPFLAGFINKSDFLDSNLYRFTKFNVEYTYLLKIRRSGIALRAFAGVGHESEKTVDPTKQDRMPFFKQYFAGGPNSMRAWRLRRLGPGSAIKDFDKNPERYGDVQLEFNVEYRFPIANIAGVKLESALFTDIGNIWFMKSSAGDEAEVFKLGRLAKDLAVGVGTGLRVDFTFFLVRVDYAYKAKDPSPDDDDAASQNKWFYNIKPFNGQLQIGINYPFKL